MTDFSGLPSYGASGSSDNSRVMQQLRSQIAMVSAQELIQKMSDKCFRKCVNYPGTELDSREQKCLSSCVDRYMEAWNTVSKSYSARLQQDRHS